MAKHNLTARMLSPTFYLADLNNELAVAAKPNAVAQARREVEAYLNAAIEREALFPDDDIGRAALLLWLLGQQHRKKPLRQFIRRRDLNRLPNGHSRFKSTILHRPVPRRPT